MSALEDRETLFNEVYGPGTGWERRKYVLAIRVPRPVDSPKDDEQFIREILDSAGFDIVVDSFEEVAE